MAIDRKSSNSPQVASANPRQDGSNSRPLDLIGDSPEIVAFGLLRYVAQVEQRSGTPLTVNRAWVLDAYAECLEAVKGNRERQKKAIPKR